MDRWRCELHTCFLSVLSVIVFSVCVPQTIKHFVSPAFRHDVGHTIAFSCKQHVSYEQTSRVLNVLRNHQCKFNRWIANTYIVVAHFCSGLGQSADLFHVSISGSNTFETCSVLLICLHSGFPPNSQRWCRHLH